MIVRIRPNCKFEDRALPLMKGVAFVAWPWWDIANTDDRSLRPTLEMELCR